MSFLQVSFDWRHGFKRKRSTQATSLNTMNFSYLIQSGSKIVNYSQSHMHRPTSSDPSWILQFDIAVGIKCSDDISLDELSFCTDCIWNNC